MATLGERAEELKYKLQRQWNEFCDEFNFFITEKRMPRSWARASARAALAWGSLCFLALIYLCVLNSQTRSYYRMQAEQKSIKKPNPPTPPVKQNKSVDWSGLEDEIANVVEEFQEAQRAQDSRLGELQQFGQLVHALSNQFEQITLPQLQELSQGIAVEAKNGDGVISVDSLQRLLTTSSISFDVSDGNEQFVSEDDLSGTLLEMKRIYDQLVQGNYDEQNGIPSLALWKGLQQALSSSTEKEPLSCPVVTAPAMNPSASAESETEYARQSDVDALVKELENLLQKRSPTTLPNLADMDRTLTYSADELRNQITVAVGVAKRKEGLKMPSSASGDATCSISEDQVTGLVEEALSAVTRGADLRNVLRRKVLELDPAATGIILDADFPWPKPRIPQPDTINLRQVLDTPLLQESIHWIDALVEAIGGHNDGLDQWLDNFASSSSSVGFALVQLLLEKSGKVELPHPQVVAKKVEQLRSDIEKKIF